MIPERYTKETIQIGLKEKIRALHVSDSHLLFSDGRDCKPKYDIAMRRWGEYVYTNVGRNITYLLDALICAKEENFLFLHTGDLIDFYSPANKEAAERFMKLSGVDYFMTVGNHEFTNYSGQHPEAKEEIKEAKENVPDIFANSKGCVASQIIGGVNFVAMDNNSGNHFPEESLELFEAEVKKGLPIVLMVHVPIFMPELADMLIAEGEGKTISCCAVPDDYPVRHAVADEFTFKFVERLKSEPLLKAVLAGHVHAHKSFRGELAPGITQLVVGGGYYGCGTVIEFV